MKEKFRTPSLSPSSPFFSQARHSNFSPSIRYQNLLGENHSNRLLKLLPYLICKVSCSPARIYNQWKGLDEFSLSILKHHFACSVNNDEGIKHYPLKKYYKNLLSYPMDAVYLRNSAIHPLNDVAVRRL